MISVAEFYNCAGCVDIMLIWVFKPNEKHDILSKVGLKKFAAGEKVNLV